ncbi:hypothetical protein OG982_19515 [Streptomyces sp. NBC_01551]|uniref:hypothetical protein n=1 Tax=Streptomyces sp. NBC_01551 TaxID=2975876 RepID=UPI00224F4AE3|nr:hypothetical protein [Streptomyces sp. NBC_01551]MCX4527843.1 hypothetical protein [Streptomyces sp. NBC_01551]
MNESWSMWADASDAAQIHQAGRDQHFVQNHYHFDPATPRFRETVQDDDDDDDDGEYVFYMGPWHIPLTVLLYLLAPVPLLVAGTSLQLVFEADPGPSIWWAMVYTACAMAVSVTIEVIVLNKALLRSPWSFNTDTYVRVLHGLAAAGLFIYSLIRSPGEAGSIGRLALDCAEVLGPL